MIKYSNVGLNANKSAMTMTNTATTVIAVVFVEATMISPLYVKNEEDAFIL